MENNFVILFAIGLVVLILVSVGLASGRIKVTGVDLKIGLSNIREITLVGLALSFAVGLFALAESDYASTINILILGALGSVFTVFIGRKWRSKV